MSQIFRAKERLMSKTKSIVQKQEQQHKREPKKFTLSSLSQHLDKSQAQVFSPSLHKARRLTTAGNENVIFSPSNKSQQIYRRVTAYNLPKTTRQNYNQSIFQQPMQNDLKSHLLYKNEIPLMIAVLPRRHNNSPIKPRQCSRSVAESFLKQKLSNQRGFIDQLFPPARSTIFFLKSDIYKFETQQILTFERASNFFPTNQLLRTYQPTSLQAGNLTNPLLFSAMTILCQDPPRLLSLFGNQEFNQQGIYYINLCKNGVWKYVFVDDFLPFSTRKKKKIPMGITNTQLWSSLLQKAVAKLYGSYFDLFNSFHQGITPFFKLLTGLPTTLYYLNKDFRSYVLIIDGAIKKNHIIILEGLQQNKIFNPHYGYKLIQLKKNGIVLRNLLNPNLITKLNFEEALMFSRLLIFRCQKDYVYHTQKLRHKKKFFSLVQVIVEETTKCYWQINQGNLNYYKPHLHINPLRSASPYRIIIRSADYQIQCEFGKQIQLKSGKILVFVHLCQQYEQDFTLIYYGQHEIKMQRQKNMKQWDYSCQCDKQC